LTALGARFLGPESWDWTLDGQNNWLKVQTHLNGRTESEARQFNEENQVLGPSVFDFTPYDERGNKRYEAVGDQLSRIFWYDAFNRLRVVQETRIIPLQPPEDCWTYDLWDEPSRWYDLEDERTRYSYDALNRRVSQTVTISGVASQSTRYVLDGMNVAEEHRGSVTLRFVHGFGVDEHVLMDNAGTRHYYVQDRLGSVVGLTDGAGGLVEAYLYQPYGELTVIQGGASGVVDWGAGGDP
jgi:YD repeat-containing protein